MSKSIPINSGGNNINLLSIVFFVIDKYYSSWGYGFTFKVEKYQEIKGVNTV